VIKGTTCLRLEIPGTNLLLHRGRPRPMATWATARGAGKKKRNRNSTQTQPTAKTSSSRQLAAIRTLAASPPRPPPLPSSSRRPPPRALPTSRDFVLARPSVVRRRRRALAPCGLRRWRGAGVRPRLASPSRQSPVPPSGHTRTCRAAAAYRGAACGSPRLCPPGHVPACPPDAWSPRSIGLDLDFLTMTSLPIINIIKFIQYYLSSHVLNMIYFKVLGQEALMLT
jgi:hypothetical protein